MPPQPMIDVPAVEVDELRGRADTIAELLARILERLTEIRVILASHER